MAAAKKAAPDPMLSAGWLDGDPAPVVMQTGARQSARSATEILTGEGTELPEACSNVLENAATSENPGRGGNWREALARADEIRFARIALKKDVKAGKLMLTDLVLAAPELDELRNATIIDVLCWKPRVGYGKARKITNGIVSEALTFGAFAKFGDATRRRLVERVAEMEGISCSTS